MDILNIYQKFSQDCAQMLCTDTRKIVPGAMFFALKGSNFDGNDFAQVALDLGCRYVIMDNHEKIVDERCIVVPDVLETLHNLARYHRRQFNIPVLAITGSNGKTTTKGLISSVLATEKNIIATEGNLNNHVGVPITLLRIQKDTEIAVIEMGANHIGEIKELCAIAEPSYGLITNIGRAHLGLFGGYAGVIQAKTELYAFLKEHQGRVFVNASDALLVEKSAGMDRVLYGPHTDGLFRVISKHTTPFVSFEWNHMVIQTQLTGEYNIDNFAAAIAVGLSFDIRPEHIQAGIEGYVAHDHRSEMHNTDRGNTIVKDFYNANVTSMEAALSSFRDMDLKKPKIVILGDMFELGEYEDEEHQRLVDFVQDAGFDQVILIGDVFGRSASDADVMKFVNVDEAIAYFAEHPVANTAVFLKASHGMHFEKLFDTLEW